jgi:RHS repeat-associated protein
MSFVDSFLRAVPRGLFRLVALVVSTALVVGGMTGVAAAEDETPASSAPAAGAGKTPNDSDGDKKPDAPDEVSAKVNAQLSGKKVEDMSARTGTSQTFARPDGSFETKSYAGLQRVQAEDGSWADVDPTLVEQPDGSLVPKVSGAGVKVSGGGDKTAAVVQFEDDQSLGFTLPENLPEPTVDGSVATYALNETTDLVVTASKTGVSVNFRINERPEPGQEPDLTLGVEAQGLDVRTNARDGITAVDDDGKLVVSSPSMVAWDAQVDEAGAPTNVVPVEPELTDGKEPQGDEQRRGDAASVQELSLTPEEGFLQDPETEYPVVVDPTTVQKNVYEDTTVRAGFGNSFGTAAVLLAGRSGEDSSSSPWISYAIFGGQNDWIGKEVIAARASFYQYAQGYCLARQLNVRPLLSYINESTTVYANRPASTSTSATTFSDQSAGCAPGRVDIPVTGMTKAWANRSLDYRGLELSVPAGNSSDGTYSRRFCSGNEAPSAGPCSDAANNPYLYVQWNTPPNKPAAPNAFGMIRGDTLWANSARPYLMTTGTDNDEDDLSYRINVHSMLSNGTADLSGSTGCFTPWVPSGEPAGCTIDGTLVEGAQYWARAMAHDASAGTATPSVFSGWTRLGVDSSTPGTPAISCTGNHENNKWYETRLTDKITCTATSAGAYEIFVNKNKSMTPTATPGTTVTKTFDVPESGVLALDFTGRSRAGKDTAASYTIGIGTSSILPVEEERTSTTVPMQAQSAPGATSAKLQWRPAGSADSAWVDAKKTDGTFDNVRVTGTNAKWTGAVKSSTTVSTVDLIWSPNNEPNISAPSHVESRVVFTYQNDLPKPTPPRSVQVVPHAFGGSFPSQDLGPGQVALFTGEFQLSETDVDVPAYSGSLTLGRSHLSLGGATSGPSGVFGPGWTADFAGPDYGVANYTVDDRRAADGSIYVTSPGGESYGYGKDDGSVGATVTGKFTGLGEYAVDEDYLTVNDAGTELKMVEADGTATKFTKTGITWLAQEVVSAEANSTVTYAYDGTNVSWIFAPKPGGVTSCNTTSQTPGCRALELVYTTVDGKTRLGEVKLHIWNPRPGADGKPGADAGMDTVTVAKYSYTTDGKLSAAWDPRADSGSSSLKTEYTYDTVGGKTVVKTVKEPGLKAWTVNYDDKTRVKTVTRAQDEDVEGASGPATWTVQYGIGLSGDGDGLPDLSAAKTATWGQFEVDAPYGGAAVFGPDQVPDATPTASQYEYADLSYWTPSGRTSNTATYGAGAWQIDSTRYDDKGNPVWQLSPAGKAKVLEQREAAAADAKAEVTSAAASKYATLTTYTSGEERRVTATYGPTSLIRAQDSNAPAGAFEGRKLTRTVYDDTTNADLKPGYPTTGVPAGGFGLPVETTERVTTGVFPYEPGSTGAPAEFDVKTTRYWYNPVVPGDGDGWQLKSPTRVRVKVGSDPEKWSTTLTRFDTEGKVIETRTPEGTETTDGAGSDSRSTKTTYYTVGANSADPLCGQAPAWAGLVCRTAPADGNAPTTRVSGYSMLLAPTRSEETQDGAARTSLTTYDEAGRTKTSATTTSGLTATDRTLPVATTNYSGTTGLVTSVTGGSKDQEFTYDSWGRKRTATDGVGSTSTTTYDAAGRVKTANDGKAKYTYTYNGTDSRSKAERRGLVTSVDVGTPSDVVSLTPTTFTGAYDGTGSLVEQNYPGGVKATWARDLNGVETGLSYTKDGAELLGFSTTIDVDGRVVTQTGGGSSQEFAYDKRDRLAQVKDTRGQQCTTRKYAFSGDSNRRKLTTYGPAASGACQDGTATTTVEPAFNADDQLGGDDYDKLGRTTTLNSGTGGTATIGYHANDMVATITQGTKSQDYTLDLSGRVSGIKNLNSGVSLTESINHYDDSEDSPAWTATKTRSDGSTGWTSTWDRNVADLAGDLGLIQKSNGSTILQLANLHGDVAATYSLGTTPTFQMASAVDEYGKPIGTPGDARYGWLGAKQRDATAIAGLTLMGARLYNPSTGRFLSRDPVPGGNDNTYTYPGDPVNGFDLTGLAGTYWKWKKDFKFTPKKAKKLVKALKAGKKGDKLSNVLAKFIPQAKAVALVLKTLRVGMKALAHEIESKMAIGRNGVIIRIGIKKFRGLAGKVTPPWPAYQIAPRYKTGQDRGWLDD